MGAFKSRGHDFGKFVTETVLKLNCVVTSNFFLQNSHFGFAIVFSSQTYMDRLNTTSFPSNWTISEQLKLLNQY